MPTNKYDIEYLHDNGEAGFDEVVTFVVSDNIQSVFCVQVDVGEASGIDGIAIRKISIPISPDGVTLSIQPEKLNEILVSLEDEGKVTSSKDGFAKIPYNYLLILDEPSRISSAYYQEVYYDEITEWLRQFLAEDGTVDQILSAFNSEQE